MFTICPPWPRAIMRRATALDIRKVPFRLVAITSSHWSAGISTTGQLGYTAASLTRTSTWPRCRVASSTIRSTPSAVRTSPATATGRPGPPLSTRTVSSARSRWRSTTATAAPSRVKAAAIPRPIPLPAPVTRTPLPEKSRSPISHLRLSALAILCLSRRPASRAVRPRPHPAAEPPPREEIRHRPANYRMDGRCRTRGERADGHDDHDRPDPHHDWPADAGDLACAGAGVLPARPRGARSGGRGRARPQRPRDAAQTRLELGRVLPGADLVFVR